MIGSDDPRLTAYAVDELDAETAAAVEATLRESASARAAVHETVEAAALLAELFAAEAKPALDAARRESIAVAVTSAPARRPWSLVAWGSLAAALLLAALLVTQLRAPDRRPRTAPRLPPRVASVESPSVAAPTPALSPVPPVPPTTPRATARAATPGRGTPVRDARPTRVAPRPAPVVAPIPVPTIVIDPATVVVQGVVTDESGAVIPGAVIHARSTLTGNEVRATTGGNGRFDLRGLSPGPLEMRAELPGFKPAVQQLSADAGAVASWSPALQVAGVNEAITVEAAKTEVAAQYAASGATIGRAPRSFDMGNVRLLAGVAGPSGVAKGAVDSSDSNTEAYGLRTDSALTEVKRHPLSTFALDVDTASYSNVRRFLMGMNQLPPADAVRIEELVNYFPYDYAPPKDGERFAADLEIAPAPWNPEHRLLRIGLKTPAIDIAHRPAANLVFLVDVSGSMNEPNKLPLVKQSLRLLVDQLKADDRVAMAVYAGAAGLVLESTPGEQKGTILAAIERLEAGGSTNGAAGIQLAYQQAAEHFVEGGINRVILATDGDFNVGLTHEGGLARLIEQKAKRGVFLSVLGFGMGNLKDSTMETLADKGNGNYAYIDTLREARKALVEQMAGTLVTVAKDVKVQIEFNPARVRAYRLLGYENRMLRPEDFKDDKKDAGEVGAGHTVTALYELVPAKGAGKAPDVDPLRYQGSRELTDAALGGELLRLKLRYKEPAGRKSQPQEWIFVDRDTELDETSADFRFAAAVAEFGMLLRDAPDKGRATFADVQALADDARGNDPFGYRAEFLELVERAAALKGEKPRR